MIILSPHAADVLAPHAEAQAWVMFVQVMTPVGMNAIKIEGVVGDQLPSRLRALDADNVFETYIVGLLPTSEDPHAVAQAIGEQFSSARIRGDWFQPTAALLAFIREHAQEALDTIIASAQSAWHAPDDVVDVDQLAGFLGVSAATVRRLVKAREIPFFRIGKHLRFVPSEVLAAIRQRQG